MINVLRQHKGAASLVFANIGVAVSVLVGAVQFLSTYEQTQADVMALHEQMDQAVRHDQLDALRVQLDEATRDVPFQLERITRLEEQVAAATSTVDLDRIKGDLDVLKERIVFVESNSTAYRVRKMSFGTLIRGWISLMISWSAGMSKAA